MRYSLDGNQTVKLNMLHVGEATAPNDIDVEMEDYQETDGVEVGDDI